MERAITLILGHVIPAVEACGAIVIVLEVARTAAQVVLNFFRRDPAPVGRLRLRLGQAMVMGLEFQVAADILKTALSPQWNDILLLAALIGLRTVLNYMLERELQVLDGGGRDKGD